MKNFKKAFTLAETITVLAIIGVIATLTIPNLVLKHQERTNITKIKKAMMTYDMAIKKMLAENTFTNIGTFLLWARDNNTCNTAKKYFKIVESDNCFFRTPDGLYWNITNINRPLVSFKPIESIQDALAKSRDKTNKDTFAFWTTYVTTRANMTNNKGLRINDLVYETTINPTSINSIVLEKLYDYITEGKIIGTGSYFTCEGASCCKDNTSGKYCFRKLDSCITEGNKYTLYGGASYSSKTCTGRYQLYFPEGGGVTSGQLYSDGSAIFLGGVFYGITDGKLTMGINRGSTQLSDMQWDENGNLIKAKSSTLGTCTTSSCGISPSPLQEEACKYGKICYYDTSAQKWKTGYDVYNEKNNKGFEIFTEYIWENYKNNN